MTPEDEARAAPYLKWWHDDISVSVNAELRWTPRFEVDVHDSRVTVALVGRPFEDYWAKADGVDEVTGCTRYKLLPMERG